MTVYTQTARFDGSARALTENELFKIAPSIFARDAHFSRSERFTPIPTIEVIRGLNREGFSVVGAQQALSRRVTNETHNKHLIRLRRLDDAQYNVGDSVFEVLLKNANDGSAAYDIMAGLFRILCANSLVAETPQQESLRVRHTGDVMGKVIEGTYTVLNRAGEIAEKAQAWRTIQLDDHCRMAFAKGALIERFGEKEGLPGVADTTVRPEQVLMPRRQADGGHDLWSTFNVAQENLIKGGMHHRTNGRNLATRTIKGIDQSVQVNKGLFAMADWLSRHAA
jgi:hypothetical protein